MPWESLKMTGRESMRSGRRPHDEWSPWVKPVLFAEIERDRRIRLARADAGQSGLRCRIGARRDTAIVVDLPGVQSLAAGFDLARDGYRPVPLYNTTSGRRQGVPPDKCVLTDVSALVTDALCLAAGSRAKCDRRGQSAGVSARFAPAPWQNKPCSRRVRQSLDGLSPGLSVGPVPGFPGNHAGDRHSGNHPAGGGPRSRAASLEGRRHRDSPAGRGRGSLASPAELRRPSRFRSMRLSRPGADGPAKEQRRRVRLRASDPEAGRRLRIRSVMERKRILVTGRVQGVGFRPTVHRLAVSLELTGFVLNDTRGVTIELQGPDRRIERVPGPADVVRQAAAGADRVVRGPGSAAVRGRDRDSSFAGVTPRGTVLSEVSADVAACADCLRELGDKGDFRYRYPFINCTNCGPRYSIIKTIPYDRPNTTMSVIRDVRAVCGPVSRRGGSAVSRPAGGVPAVRAEGVADRPCRQGAANRQRRSHRGNGEPAADRQDRRDQRDSADSTWPAMLSTTMRFSNCGGANAGISSLSR